MPASLGFAEPMVRMEPIVPGKVTLLVGVVTSSDVLLPADTTTTTPVRVCRTWHQRGSITRRSVQWPTSSDGFIDGSSHGRVVRNTIEGHRNDVHTVAGAPSDALHHSIPVEAEEPHG